jgi:shikimate kinase
MRVFLVGFMCSGKSRIGRELAQRMGLRHIDIDRVIEQRIGPITPWFQKNGEEAFREMERKVLAELLTAEQTVISTGGGTPVEGDNMKRMLAAGTVVYLDVPFEELLQRVEQKGGDRPLLFGLKDEVLRSRVEELLSARLPFYMRAQMRVRASGEPHVIAERIQQGLEGEAGRTSAQER